jgi:tryptophan halogenase
VVDGQGGTERAGGRRRIVIAGDGLAAWMAAAALAETVGGNDWSITVVGNGEGDEHGPAFGDADATLPMPDGCHPALDVDQDRFVIKADGTFSFGLALSGWSASATTYFHPFSTLGAPLGSASFHQIVMRLRREGQAVRLGNYSLAALAAQAGRFERPYQEPVSVLSTCGHGVHLDGRKLARMLRGDATAAGVEAVTEDLDSAERDARGAISALVTKAGRRIGGDLFLDCTGTRAWLVSRLEGCRWEDWSRWLPCNRVMSAAFRSLVLPPPHSHHEAHRSGWIRHLPLHGKTQLSGFYRGDLTDDDQMRAMLEDCAEGEELLDVQAAPASFGRRGEPWHRNCVALGTAAALLDPVGLSNLEILRSGIDRLLRLLPGSPAGTVEAAEYNRRTTAELDNARDFAMLHYRLNGRRGDPMWDECRAMAVPASLGYKMKLFEARGKVAMYDQEPFEEASWTNLFDEHGVRPRHYNPVADGFESGELQAHLEKMRAYMLGALRTMPLHADYLLSLHGKMGPEPSTVHSVTIEKTGH